MPVSHFFFALLSLFPCLFFREAWQEVVTLNPFKILFLNDISHMNTSFCKTPLGDKNKQISLWIQKNIKREVNTEEQSSLYFLANIL